MSQLNPSWRTICAMLNSMIGGTMLTLPILFREAGLVVGVLILLVSGWVSYKTCSLYVIHMSERETEIEETIRRILGRKGENFFRFITGVYLLFLNIIYVDLISDQAFNVLYFILHKTDHADWITEKNLKEIVFDKISVQVISLAFFIPLLLTMFIKNLSFLVKLTSIGVVSVITYTTFILSKFFPALPHIDLEHAKLFSLNFGNLAGTCAVAFTIHTVVNPILKANRNQHHNLRDLKIVYFLGFLVYASIGLLGSLPILDAACEVTIINCYLEQIPALVVEVVYFFMLLTVFPCFINVGRTRLLTFFFGSVQDKHLRVFNVLFMLVASMFAFLSPFLRLDMVMNIVGAFFCFFFIYYIPIRFHWACLYKRDSLEEAIVGSDNSAEHLQDSILSSKSEDRVEIGEKVKCFHGYDETEKTSRPVRLVGYTAVMVVGVAVGVYGVYNFVREIAGSVQH